MTHTKSTLHFFCGKIGSGKSTLAAKIAEETGAILISEDHWTASLWPGELQTLADYKEKSTRLKSTLWPLLSQVLQAGTSLVLDFPANTIQQRAALRTLIDMAGAAHTLHLLETPDDVCKARLRARNQSGEHAYEVSEEMFDQVSSYFVPPTPDEAFRVQTWPCET